MHCRKKKEVRMPASLVLRGPHYTNKGGPCHLLNSMHRVSPLPRSWWGGVSGARSVRGE